MKIDQNTKYIARLHKKASPRGLNIYNPFFEEAGINCLFILFYNESPKPLIEGLKNLNFLGAISAGFESDPILPTLLDDLDAVSKFVKRVGYIKNNDGKLIGCSQGGEGLLRSIEERISLEEKTISLVGSGMIAKSFLFVLKERGIVPTKISVFNRTLTNAENLKTDLAMNIEIRSLSELNGSKGDVLINATDIGGSVDDNLFTPDIISGYNFVSDVTFEKENTNLINLAKSFNKGFSTGWDMFSHQGVVILENLLEKKIDINLFRKHVKIGLSETVN